MKKFLLFIFVLCATNVFAQKSYVHIYAYNLDSKYDHYMYLSGDLPSGIEEVYGSGDNMLIGNLLNLLSEQGFEVESMSAPNFTKESGVPKMCYLLSKKGTGGSTSSARAISADDDTEVHEVARYNLQGMPIGKNEKGIQIVVYSNYTTKTIIKE
jgi:hypothetical protein